MDDDFNNSTDDGDRNTSDDFGDRGDDDRSEDAGARADYDRECAARRSGPRRYRGPKRRY